MYNIILDGEVVETVHYTNIYEVRHYVKENYDYYGDYPTIKMVKEWLNRDIIQTVLKN